MPAYFERGTKEEREEVFGLVHNGETTIRKGAKKLGIPYSTIMSRKYRWKSLERAFLDPFVERDYSEEPGNAAWQELSDEVPSHKNSSSYKGS